MNTRFVSKIAALSTLMFSSGRANESVGLEPDSRAIISSLDPGTTISGTKTGHAASSEELSRAILSLEEAEKTAYKKAALLCLDKYTKLNIINTADASKLANFLKLDKPQLNSDVVSASTRIIDSLDNYGSALESQISRADINATNFNKVSITIIAIAACIGVTAAASRFMEGEFLSQKKLALIAIAASAGLTASILAGNKHSDVLENLKSEEATLDNAKSAIRKVGTLS